MQKILIGLPDDLLAELDALAHAQGVSRSELVRLAIRELVDWSRAERLRALAAEGYQRMASEDLQEAKAFTTLGRLEDAP